MKRFLVIHAWGIGDWIFFSPVLHSILAAHPNSTIDVILGTPATESVVRLYPKVHVAGIFDVRRSPWRIIGFALRAMRHRYDALIFSAGMDARKCGAVAKLFRAAIKVGVTKRGSARGVEGGEYDVCQHAVDNNHKVIRALGLPLVHGGHPYLPTVTGLTAVSKSVLIHPGCDQENAFKRWPTERFVEVARELLRGGARVSVILGPSELDLAPKFHELDDHPLFSVLKNLSFSVAVDCIVKHQIFLNSDSGLGHVASALGKVTISIFGPAVPSVARPYGSRAILISAAQADAPPCMPCMRVGGRRGCDEQPCLKAVSVDSVLDTVNAALSALNRANGASGDKNIANRRYS
jgi:ADP-heptose:LPS heptosyltransferase